jgi:hypothetical protein
MPTKLIRQPASRDVLEQEEWVSVLKLATMWDFEDIRNEAINRVALMTRDPVEKIVLARTYHVEQWLVPALNDLVRRTEPLSLEEAVKLGWDYTLKIGQVREGFRPHVTLNSGRCYACGRYSGCVEQSRTTHDFSSQIRSLFSIQSS